MVNLLIRWSLAHRLPVLFLAGLLIVVGALVTVRMPVDVFPDLTAPTVTVIVEGHGISPKEMETQVTFPIEAAVNGAPDVRRVRSGTALGIAVVWVEFEWGTDIFRARQTITERLAAVAGSLPPQVEAPKLAPASSIMGEILFVSLTSPSHSQLDLLLQHRLERGVVDRFTFVARKEQPRECIAARQAAHVRRFYALHASTFKSSHPRRSANNHVSPCFTRRSSKPPSSAGDEALVGSSPAGAV